MSITQLPEDFSSMSVSKKIEFFEELTDSEFKAVTVSLSQEEINQILRVLNIQIGELFKIVMKDHSESNGH